MKGKKMMTKTARLAATCGLGLALAFGGVAASAAIDVPVAEAATTATYTVYQIMKGDITAASGADGKTTYKITAGTLNVDNKDAVVDAINAVDANANLRKDSKNLNAEVQDAINSLEKAGKTQAFANELAGATLAATGDVNAAEKDGKQLSVTLGQNGVQGYYLVVGASTTTDAAISATLVPVDIGGTTVELKKYTPTVKLETSSSEWGVIKNSQDAESVTAPTFKITGTLPNNYAEYSKYAYTITSILPKGLDIAQGEIGWSMAVKVVNTTDSKTEEKVLTDGFKYSVETDSSKTSTLKWIFDDLKTLQGVTIDKDSKIVVEYTPQLNSEDIDRIFKDKTSFDENGMPTAYASVTFSSSPYSNKTNTAKTSTTPAKSTPMRSYNVTINSVDEKGTLDGAAFTLSNSGGKIVGKDITIGKNQDGTAASFTFTGLESGKVYTLSETTVPAGKKKIEDVKFQIDTTRSDVTQQVNGVIYNEAQNGDPSDAVTGDVDANNPATINLTVKSVDGINLPLTGHAGIMAGVVAGGLLITVSVAAIARNRREDQAE